MIPKIASATLVILFAASGLSGCLATVDRYYAFDGDPLYINPGVFNGTYMLPDANGSTVLKRGYAPYGDPEVYRLLSKRPAGPVLHETENAVYIPIAVWKPIDGYYTGKLPVIVDAGPYFEQDVHCWSGGPVRDCPPEAIVEDTIGWPGQTTPFSLKNFLPHGYAVAQIAVRGTGSAGGCMELMGPNEQSDLNQAITWLANQEWSNGNVTMIGASYDGSTPWMVAAAGNEALKTIVPVAGLPDIYDLMFRNGTSETRGDLMVDQVYWPFGFSDEFPHPLVGLGGANDRQPYQDRQNLLCPEAYEGMAMGRYATYTGDRGDELANFWSERDYRDDILRNYKGSVFLIHGFQDWNVDPHAAIPFNEKLREAGLEVKEWYGQWGHAFPDSQCLLPRVTMDFSKDQPRWVTNPCRTDYAEVLLHWFDYYLKGNRSVDRGPMVQLQDNHGYWRSEETYPPNDAQWTTLYPSKDGKIKDKAPAADSSVLTPPAGRSGAPTQYLEFKTEPFTEDVRISGMPRVHVDFEALGSGGQIGAWFFDEAPDGRVHARLAAYDYTNYVPVFARPAIVGHGQMDLRFRDGGEESRPVVPGVRSIARMQLEPLDILIPAGHRLTVWLFQYQYGDHYYSATPAPIRVHYGDKTTIQLPMITVEPTELFPVPGIHFPKPEYFSKYLQPKPRLNQVVPPMSADEADCYETIGARLLGVPVAVAAPGRCVIPYPLPPVMGHPG